MRARAGIGSLVLVAALATAGAGCGSGEQTFSSEELIETANEHGAGLTLGAALASTQEGIDLRAVDFEEGTESAQPGTDPHAHGGGTLAIAADGDAALAEYERCESAASLICFRAANAVLFFENEAPADDLDRLGRAIRAFAE